AQPLADGDRLVAFLVDEAAQGGANLNGSSAGLLPARCAGLEDTDSDDHVLHFLFHRSWSQDPALFPPANTGLAGCERVFVQESADGARHLVGTIAPEAAEGTCSLNGDADQDDRALRWVEVTPGAVLFRPDLVALHDAPGGAHGVVEVEGRFVAILSEAQDGQDLSGDPARDLELLAWIDPFARQGNPEEWELSTKTRSAEWMTQEVGQRELVFSVHESSLRETSCNGDDDFDDAFAMFGRFESEGLVWRGYCYATERFNAGQVLIDGVAFFRADEAGQDRDINEDGDLLDQVLVRHTVFPFGRLYYVGTLNDLPMPSVFRGDGDVVAFLQDESLSGRDANADGDAADFVLRTISIR
ncbi:MAG: hypothetical protein L0206_13065, partial [Actinobacteria bacterium]|nr:hypothetical protein [Actinomycetota bacterium]